LLFAFEEIYDGQGFGTGLVAAKMAGQWGVMGTDGSEKLPFQYRYVFILSPNAIGCAGSTHFYVLSTQGDTLAGPYTEMYENRYGRNLVKNGKKATWLNIHTGKEIAPLGYEIQGGNPLVGGARQGLNDFALGYEICTKNGKWGVIDSLGKEIVPFTLYMIRNTGTKNRFLAMTSTKWQLIGENGTPVSETIYDDLQISGKSIFAKSGKKWALLSTDGKNLTDYIFDELPVSGTENFLVGIKEGKKGIFDTNGKIIREFELSSVTFKNNLIAIERNKKFGVIDLEGKEILPFKYQDVGLYARGKAVMIYGEKSEISGDNFIYLNGKLQKMDYTDILELPDGRYWAKDGLKWNLMDENFKPLGGKTYDDMKIIGAFWAAFDRDHWVLLNGKTEAINTQFYDDLGELSPNGKLIYVFRGEKEGYVDAKGREYFD